MSSLRALTCYVGAFNRSIAARLLSFLQRQEEHGMRTDVVHRGLSSAEARARLRQHGPNALPAQGRKTFWRRFLDQFRSPLIYVLLFALAVDGIVWFFEGARALPVESVAILVILLLNAGLGVYQESKAEAALERLKKLATPLVWVLRDGRLVRLPSDEIVPGDVVRVEAGERIPVDGRLVEAQGVMVDESMLTGESVPVDKELGDEVFSGTLVVRGKGYLEASRTGAASTMGRLAVMLGAIETAKTPLERRLEAFGNRIARAVLLLSALIAVGGLLVEGYARFGRVLLFSARCARCSFSTWRLDNSSLSTHRGGSTQRQHSIRRCT